VRRRGNAAFGVDFDKLNNQLVRILILKKKVFITPFVYVNLREFGLIFDDIVILIQLNHTNN